jgi:hypothetical protein
MKNITIPCMWICIAAIAIFGGASGTSIALVLGVLAIMLLDHD